MSGANAEDGGRANASSTSTSTGQPDKPDSQPNLVQLHADLMSRVERSRATFQQRYAEEYANYGRAVAAAQQELKEAMQNAAWRYGDEVKEAWGPNELTERTTQAYQSLAKLVQQLGNSEYLRREVERGYNRFLDNLSRPVAEGGEAEISEAQQDYLGALEKASGLPEIWRQAVQAHAEYLVLLRQLHQERRQRLQDACTAYANAVGEAPSATSFYARANAAAETGMAVLQQAWKQACEECHQAWADAMKSVEAFAQGGGASSRSQ